MSNLLLLPPQRNDLEAESSELLPVEQGASAVIAGESDGNAAIASEIPPEPTEPEKQANTVVVTEQVNHPAIILLRLVLLTFRGIFLAFWYSLRGTGRYLLNHPIHALLTAVLVTLLSVVIITGSEIHNQLILSKISDQTVDAVIEASRFNRNFEAEAININGAKELLRVGAPTWIQREGVRAILFHARKAGLSLEDQAVLLATADVESGFNPMARAPTSTACGLFQFVKRTGELFGLPQSNCMDPWENARAGIAHFQFNMDRRILSQVGNLTGAERVFRTYELSYYLHHDGPESSNPGNDVKATILNGSQFLFKAYRALQTEHESQNRAPTFAEQFSTNLLKLLDSVREWIRSPTLPSITAAFAMISPENQDQTEGEVTN